MDNIDMTMLANQISRYFRIPDSIAKNLIQHPLLKDLLVLSCGYRSGLSTKLGCNIEKTANNEFFVKYCIAGEGWFEANGIKYTVKSGDIIICKNKTPHKYGTDAKNPWRVYWVYFQGDLCNDYIRLFDLEKDNHVFYFGIDAKLESSFYELLKEMEKGYARQYQIYVANLLKTLLSYIHIKVEPQIINADNRFEDILLYMIQNLHTTLSLDTLSTQLHLSKDHFTKLFKKQYGFTPIDYFIHLKMQKACELITTTSLPLNIIADKLGYSDYYYFSRLFKDKIGLSPKEYKTKH